MNDWEQSRDNGFEPDFSPGYPQDPRLTVRRKSKWLAGILAFLVPGIGHLYLGLMAKGIAIMLLVAADICAIVFAATNGLSPLVIVLLSLLMPIIYFYNLFDALQSTDAVNDRRGQPGWTGAGYFGSNFGAPHDVSGAPQSPTRSVPASGLLLLAAAGVILVLAADIRWTHWPFRSTGAMVGAILLIGAGVVLWFWEMRGQPK